MTEATEQPDKQPAKEIRSAREPSGFCPCGAGVHHPPMHGCVHQPRSSPNLIVWGFPSRGHD